MAKQKAGSKGSDSPSRTSNSGRKLASGGKQETPGKKVKLGTTDLAGSGGGRTRKSSDRA